MRVHSFNPFLKGSLIGLGLLVCCVSGAAFASEAGSSYLVSYAEEAATQPQTSESVCCPSACGNDCCGPKWVFGAEASFLAPIQGDRPMAFRTYTGSTVSDEFTPNDSKPDGLVATPRIWLGVEGEKWGALVRYWNMEESAGVYTPGNVYSSNFISNCFRAQTLDLEATRRFCWRNTNNIFSAGLRYAELDERTTQSVVDAMSATDFYSGYTYARHHFGGVGFTTGLQGLKPINDCGLNLFYNVRGSWLFNGANTANVVETHTAYGGGDGYGGATNGAATSGCNGDLFIGELQLGTQWNFALCERCNDAFFRIALEYQYWDTSNTGYVEAGSRTASTGYAATSTASSGDTHVSMVGFLLGAGFNY